VDAYMAVQMRVVRNTFPANFLGLCALTLPVGVDSCGMPVGLQLQARAGCEERLLEVALAIEQRLGTSRQRLGTPPVIEAAR
jgi:aspartyl-tRNA(Asn)/glutamyl-tRNA(Gln) amidotransferase subunit A